MYLNKKIVLGKNDEKFIELDTSMLNRHGVITGATGTGKSVTLKVLAESMSSAGIPTIVMDIKGDLSGCARIGEMNENVEKRVTKFGLDNFELRKFPVRFWDVFGKSGHPLRLTITDMGPTLLSKVFDLTDAGEGILNIAFKMADEKGLELIDLKDLKAMLQYLADNAKELQMEYGNINTQSVATILRKLLSVDGEQLFGEPNLNLDDLVKCTEESGMGYLNIIECRELIKNPTLYATILVWLLSSFYERMPEVGDLEKPKAVLFLDEAHLIFNEMEPEVIKKITQIIKLIRSKGVGVFFISQSPSDIPNEVLSQLGNRVQHCLRAYTPQELKAVKVAAQTFRENPNLNTEEAILELGTGEALISTIDEEGLPTIVERAKILPPQSYMGEITEEEMKSVIENSIMETKYRQSIDKESAYEKISVIFDKKEEERLAEEQKKLDEKQAKEDAKKQIILKEEQFPEEC